MTHLQDELTECEEQRVERLAIRQRTITKTCMIAIPVMLVLSIVGIVYGIIKD